MQDYYAECAEWMTRYLETHIVLRSSISILGKSVGRATEVSLFTLTKNKRLACFNYHSFNFPISRPFYMTPIDGMNLSQQIDSLMRTWEKQGVTFWTATEQAVACELGPAHIMAVNAYSIELLFKYHRLLACLEANPRLEGLSITERCTIEDVARAHMRLQSLLEQRTELIKESWESLKALNID